MCLPATQFSSLCHGDVNSNIVVFLFQRWRFTHNWNIIRYYLPTQWIRAFAVNNYLGKSITSNNHTVTINVLLKFIYTCLQVLYLLQFIASYKTEPYQFTGQINND